MLEAVPLRIQIGLPEPMRAGEVDDDCIVRRLDCGRVGVVEAEEDELRARGTCRLVRHECRERPVQPHVERGSCLPGVRVGAERDDLEPGVREDAVERLLTGIPAASENGCCDHRMRIMPN